MLGGFFVSFRSIYSYVPELSALKSKKGLASRPCHEDFLILDAMHPERILASRVGSPSKGEFDGSLFAFSREDLQFLRAQMTHHRVLMLGREDAPVLLFCDLCPDATVLVALLPHLSAPALLSALNTRAPYLDLILSPALSALSPAESTDGDGVLALLDDWLYYRSRICSKSASVGTVERCLLISQFVGFSVTYNDLPQMPTELPISDRLRFSAFFLCALLAFRTTDAHLFTNVETEISAQLQIKLGSADSKASGLSLDLPFLSHPAFGAFGISREDGGLRFEIRATQTNSSLSLWQSARVETIFQILLQIAPFSPQ